MHTGLFFLLAHGVYFKLFGLSVVAYFNGIHPHSGNDVVAPPDAIIDEVSKFAINRVAFICYPRETMMQRQANYYASDSPSPAFVPPACATSQPHTPILSEAGIRCAGGLGPVLGWFYREAAIVVYNQGVRAYNIQIDYALGLSRPLLAPLIPPRLQLAPEHVEQLQALGLPVPHFTMKPGEEPEKVVHALRHLAQIRHIIQSCVSKISKSARQQGNARAGDVVRVRRRREPQHAHPPHAQVDTIRASPVSYLLPDQRHPLLVALDQRRARAGDDRSTTDQTPPDGSAASGQRATAHDDTIMEPTPDDGTDDVVDPTQAGRKRRHEALMSNLDKAKASKARKQRRVATVEKANDADEGADAAGASSTSTALVKRGSMPITKAKQPPAATGARQTRSQTAAAPSSTSHSSRRPRSPTAAASHSLQPPPPRRRGQTRRGARRGDNDLESDAADDDDDDDDDASSSGDENASFAPNESDAGTGAAGEEEDDYEDDERDSIEHDELCQQIAQTSKTQAKALKRLTCNHRRILASLDCPQQWCVRL
jgi:hypothetical protein